MRRRRLLATLGTGLATLAGCTNRGDEATSPGDGTSPGSPPPTSPPTGEDRPTLTPRDPRTLEVGGAWRQVGADAGHSGVEPDASGVPTDGGAYWHLRRIRSGPAVLADDRLYHYGKVGADTSGEPTRTRTREEPAGTAHPVYGEPALFARDPADGTIRWTLPLRGPGVRWPAATDDGVVVGVNGQLAAVDRDGSVRWDRDLGDRILGDPTVVGDAVLVPIQGVVDGQSGETLQAPAVRAYALADGSERWTASPPKRSNSLAVATDHDTVVVVSGGYDGTGVVLGYALANGSERWRVETPGDFFEGPVAAGGTVYVSNGDGLLRAFAADGNERWRRSVESHLSVAAVAGTAYIGVGSTIRALASADGSERWQVEHAGSFGPLAVGEEVIYAGTRGEDARLYALAAGDGTERWHHGFPFTTVEGDMMMAGLQAQPTIADGAVYAFAADGLYAFGPDG